MIAGLDHWSGLVGDPGPPLSVVGPAEVQSFRVEVLGGVDVTAGAIKRPEVLGP